MKKTVVPAYAGVIPDSHLQFSMLQCGPRIRGGDPITCNVSQRTTEWSPHTRG